ncbi:hypothetical protein DRZ77_02915 [Candidatus Woesearchaeota archaeon]|mgnify:CR=1 FL=1|nr:MAG: hypothetical protein DRZ77_02915 [Candidatus Woesearchaeota archaeon]
MTKQISFPTALSAVIIVGLLIAGYVFGWVTPSQDPPEGDLDAPLDTSDTAQTKSGDLTINGTLTLGSQLISQVASGTAPFSIDSPTLVTNLNADKLDGYDAADLSAGGGAITYYYLTTTTYTGDHNCDDSPSNCCDSGYHMCTYLELSQGKSLLASGKSVPSYGTSGEGWIQCNTSYNNNGCNDWESSDSGGYGCQVYLQSSGYWNSPGTASCDTSLPVWCCSDL